MDLDDVISKEKGLSINDCVKKADKYIKKNGVCLLLLDVKGSSKYKNPDELTANMMKMVKELNAKFEQYLPENYLTARYREKNGFSITHGDAIWAEINNSEVIMETKKYLDENYSQIAFYWGIAKDGWDKEGLSVIG